MLRKAYNDNFTKEIAVRDLASDSHQDSSAERDSLFFKNLILLLHPGFKYRSRIFSNRFSHS